MRNFLENLKQALGAIKQNRLRTLMSIAGIAFGIASVVTVGVISQGGRDYIYSELETYGLNSIWVYREWEEDNPFAKVREGSGITNDDYAAMKKKICCPSVMMFSPSVYPEEWMKNLRVGNSFNNSSVEGVDVDYLKINNDSIEKGRNFRKDDIVRKKHVAIIGFQLKENLFGSTNPIGKSLHMGDVKFTVIGVLKFKNREFLNAIGATQGFEVNERMLIPYTSYQQIMGTKDIHTMRAEAMSGAVVNKALDEIIRLLHRRHGNRYTYQTESMLAWIETTNDVLGMVTLIGVVSAVVSLFVGGVGVFNIMSSSVIERTREIGIRKALGARKADIMLQFLMESTYISVIGGIAGIVLSWFVLVSLIFFADFTISSAWIFLSAAIFVSTVVGLLAGYFPAKHAASLSPSDALRFEN